MSKDEIEQSRNANEYISWFESKLEVTRQLNRKESAYKDFLLRNTTVNNKKTLLIKKFYEELFPLYRLIQSKRMEWNNVLFKPIMGSQNYDVEITPQTSGVPEYLEITVADMNEYENARMEYFCTHPSVSMIDDVTISRDKEKGRIITVREDTGSQEKVNLEIAERIKNLINNKMEEKKRPNNTALLVHFDDYTAFRYDSSQSRDDMNSFLDNLELKWFKRYSFLYLRGASGKSFYERSAQNETS
ncbi:MAG: hypothetical protein ABIH42_06675 [Planctomycetota bacterium]